MEVDEYGAGSGILLREDAVGDVGEATLPVIAAADIEDGLLVTSERTELLDGWKSLPGSDVVRAELSWLRCRLRSSI